MLTHFAHRKWFFIFCIKQQISISVIRIFIWAKQHKVFLFTAKRTIWIEFINRILFTFFNTRQNYIFIIIQTLTYDTVFYFHYHRRIQLTISTNNEAGIFFIANISKWTWFITKHSVNNGWILNIPNINRIFITGCKIFSIPAYCKKFCFFTYRSCIIALSFKRNKASIIA